MLQARLLPLSHHTPPDETQGSRPPYMPVQDILQNSTATLE